MRSWVSVGMVSGFLASVKSRFGVFGLGFDLCWVWDGLLAGLGFFCFFLGMCVRVSVLAVWSGVGLGSPA